MRDIVIEAHGLKRYYQRGSETVKALDGVDVSIRAGEIVVDPGAVRLGEDDADQPAFLPRRADRRDAAGGRQVGGGAGGGRTGGGAAGRPGFRVPTVLVAADADGDGERRAAVDVSGPAGRTRGERGRFWSLVGLGDRADHLPREFSGGQMQRVAIARALIADPKILVADEPTGNLDRATGESIIELFKSLAAEQGLAIILTTHNAEFGYQADRVITLQDGRIVKEEVPKRELVGA